jgi:hypothetical protein
MFQTSMNNSAHFTVRTGDFARQSNDYYPTPAWVTQLLLDAETFSGSIFEPASGQNHMLDIIQQKYPSATGSDIIHGDDFLNSDTSYDNIITNPPFSLSSEFIKQANTLATEKVCLLFPVNYLASQSRKLLFDKYRPSRIRVICKRLKIETNRGVIHSAFNHAWFIWDKQSVNNETTIH